MERAILVIQPNEDSFALLQQQLIALHFSDNRIVHCSSPADALSKDPSEFGLILATLTLTPIDSLSPVKELKRHFNYCTLIVLSDRNDTETHLYAISQGAEEVLVNGSFDISQLKKAITIARERNALSKRINNVLEDYKRHFNNGPIPMWIVDESSMRFLIVNNAAVEKYGYTREEYKNMSVLDIHPAEDIPKLLGKYTGNKTDYFDAGYWRHVKKNGEVFYVHIYTHNTLFENVNGRLCFAVDVNDKLLTDRRNKELMALTIEQKEQLDNILSSINEAIWSRDAETHELLYCNNAYYELYGYKLNDPVLKKSLDMKTIHPDDLETFTEALREVKRAGKVDYIYRYVHTDGSIKILKGSATFKKGTDGKPDTIDGITTDITKEKELYNEIRNSEQKLLTTINNTKDLIWSVNKDLKIIFCNKPYQDFFNKWFGISLDEGDYVLGKWHSDAFIDKRKKEYGRALNGESFTTIVEEHFDGGTQYFEINSSPIIDVDEKIVGVNCVSRDITAEQKQSNKIKRQNEQLRDIAWIQSHKVRGPVASILGLIPLFDIEKGEIEYNKDIIEKLLTAANQLDDVIKEIVIKTKEIAEVPEKNNLPE